MRQIGPWLTEQLDAIGGGHLAERVGEFELAVHELAVNIVDHAYDEATHPNASLDIAMHCDGPDLVIEFTDTGIAYDDGDRPVVGDEPTVRGYGLFIVEQLAKSINYERKQTVNHWTLVFAPS
ncbi:hypothetical protein GQR58_030083 [Nymphon striatum]|nr:hypothetical protein GQR58_030083 [Nymphon striatum]